METLKAKEKLFISLQKIFKGNTNSALKGTGGNSLEPRQKVMTLLIGVVLIVLSMQVAGATYCPECQVHYGSDVMSVNAPASAPQDAPGHIGPLSVLDPSTAFTSPSQVNLANIVLQLL